MPHASVAQLASQYDVPTVERLATWAPPRGATLTEAIAQVMLPAHSTISSNAGLSYQQARASKLYLTAVLSISSCAAQLRALAAHRGAELARQRLGSRAATRLPRGCVVVCENGFMVKVRAAHLHELALPRDLANVGGAEQAALRPASLLSPHMLSVSSIPSPVPLHSRSQAALAIQERYRGLLGRRARRRVRLHGSQHLPLVAVQLRPLISL